MTEMILLSCSKQKQPGVDRAEEKYEPSPIFRKRRKLAWERADYWGILSAKHGYLRRWDAIKEYDTHISSRSPIWGAFVLQELLADLDYWGVDQVTVLAGRRYVDPLVTELEAHGYDVVDLHRGLMPGQRMAALDEAIQPGVQSNLIPDENEPSWNGPCTTE
jgi:hypothetical protein